MNDNLNKRITGKDILEMCPGLKEAMDEVLEKARRQVANKVEVHDVLPSTTSTSYK